MRKKLCCCTVAQAPKDIMDKEIAARAGLVS